MGCSSDSQWQQTRPKDDATTAAIINGNCFWLGRTEEKEEETRQMN
jgi:hypothetical protein